MSGVGLGAGAGNGVNGYGNGTANGFTVNNNGATSWSNNNESAGGYNTSPTYGQERRVSFSLCAALIFLLSRSS